MKINQKTLYLIGGITAAVLLAAVILFLTLGGSGRKYEKHYDAAQSAFLQKDYDKALRELDKALDKAQREDAYLLMADIYYAQGDTDMATSVLYLGYSHTGSEEISAMLERLKAEQIPVQTDETQSIGISVAEERFAPDTTSAVLSDRGLGNADLLSISALTALEDLTLSGNSISDISPLASLRNLTSLQLSDNRVSDLSPLSGLPMLKTLYLDGNPVTDFTPLESLTALRTLSMKGITITDTQLATLQKALPNCRIYCDEPVKSIPEITIGGRTVRADVTELSLGGLGLEDISALAECTELRELDLRDNRISDITPLANLTKLERLCLWNNRVEDLLPLLGLTHLRYLDVDTNAVTDIIALSQLTNLEELWLNNNALASVEPLRGLTALTRLGLKNVGLDDDALEILMGLPALHELSIEENEGLSQEKFDALQEALPKCVITHSELVAPEEPEEEPETPELPVTPDAAYVSVGANAAVNVAGTGTGYAVVWDGADAVSVGVREGFIAQAESLGMNVVADLRFSDMAAEAQSLVIGLRALGADTVIFAAGDDALGALLGEAAAITYEPQIIQVY